MGKVNLFRAGEMGVMPQKHRQNRSRRNGSRQKGKIRSDSLCKSPVWHADGAFINGSVHFFQLYACHGIVLEQLLPPLHCLLTKQQFAIYFAERHGRQKGSRHFLFFLFLDEILDEI